MRDGTYYARHGAGLYGVDGGSHKTPCAQSNNPYGHSPDCPCRKAQQVPYWEPDVEQLIDDYKDRVQARTEVEADRQRGYEI